MHHDGQDENMPLLLFASPKPTMGQHDEERELVPRAASSSLRVEDVSMAPPLSRPMHPSMRGQQDHKSSLPSLPEGWRHDFQHSVSDRSASNIATQQAEIQHPRSFSLSVPTQSSIMLRRNAQGNSVERMQKMNPQRVENLISRLGLDEQRSKTLFSIIIATAPFHIMEPPPTQSPREENNSEADALREALDSLMFAPNSSIAITPAEGFLAGDSTENPTENLLFDANVADGIVPHSDSPPLLWSSAEFEESLDLNAGDPTYFTVAEFINTIIEKRIQVESVTDEDWCIEELRVAILNRLMIDSSLKEELTAEAGLIEVAVTTEEEIEQVEPKDASLSDLMSQGDSSGLEGKTSGHVKIKEGTSQADLSVKQDSNKPAVTRKERTTEIKAREDISEVDLQRWKKQGSDAWLKRHDGTDMNEEEVDDECVRWDAMVRKARLEKSAEMAAPSLHKEIDPNDKDFRECV